MNLSLSKNRFLNWNLVAFAGAGLIIGKMITIEPKLAGFAIAGMALFMSVSKSPLKALSILLFLIPFSAMPILNQQVISAPGARPILLLGVFVAFIAVINHEKAVKMPTIGAIFSGFMIMLFALTVIRSISFLPLLSATMEQRFTPVNFLLSHFVKPLVYFVPVFIVMKFARDRKEIEYVMNMLVWALIVFSLYLLYYYAAKGGGGGGVDAAAEFVVGAVGLQKNAAGRFYSVAFPIVIARYFIKKDAFSLIAIGTCVMAVALLYSRTAYVTIVLSVLFYLYLTKRLKNYLPALITIGFIGSFVISASIMERATKGMEDNDLNQVSAGRIDKLWVPLLTEYSENPGDIILGQGRFGMVNTMVHQSGVTLGASHPHNMYLEMLFDTGVLGLSSILVFYFVIIKRTHSKLGKIKDPKMKEFQTGALVGMLNFMASGFTGGTIFPNLENSFFLVMIAVSMVIIHLNDRPEKEVHVQA